MKKWNSLNLSETLGFQYFVHSNWNICKQVKLILFQTISKFLILIG